MLPSKTFLIRLLYNLENRKFGRGHYYINAVLGSNHVKKPVNRRQSDTCYYPKNTK